MAGEDAKYLEIQGSYKEGAGKKSVRMGLQSSASKGLQNHMGGGGNLEGECGGRRKQPGRANACEGGGEQGPP